MASTETTSKRPRVQEGGLAGTTSRRPRVQEGGLADTTSQSPRIEEGGLADITPNALRIGEGASADDHAAVYMSAAAALAVAVSPARLDAMALGLARVRDRGGRLFVLGVGGGAGHASHAVNDFRKLCLFESYAPTDNVSELTARTNDDGWETSFSAWLEVSHLCRRDALLVFSVGGGSREHAVSVNLVHAMEAAHQAGAAIYGVVGAPGGALAELADVAILIAAPAALRTPLVESFQAVVWHALVSHPRLALKQGHWESLAAGTTTGTAGTTTGAPDTAARAPQPATARADTAVRATSSRAAA